MQSAPHPQYIPIQHQQHPNSSTTSAAQQTLPQQPIYAQQFQQPIQQTMQQEPQPLLQPADPTQPPASLPVDYDPW